MEKVNAMKKVALFFMTQRVVRPMKFAAFISIIVSLAVMIGACQGAVGKAGKDGVGATGATGVTGVTGETGPAGAASFGLRLNVPTVTFNVIPAGTSETKKSIPFTNYYRGGQGEVEFDYTVPDPPPQDPDFTPMLSMDKQNLELSVIADADGFDNNSFMVTATDGDGIVLTIDVVARRNKAPISATEKITPALVIGTQPDPAKTPVIPAKTDCDQVDTTTYNKCKLAFDVIVATSPAATTIQVDDHDVVTFTAVASSDSSKATAEIVDKGKSIVVTGVASTNTIEDTTDTDKPVTITITASDDGDLTGTTTIDVTVDGEPKLRAGGIRDQAIKVGPGSLLTGVSAFFMDDKAATTTFTVADVGMGTEIVASKSEAGVLSGLAVSGQDITVVANNEGLAVVKVTVSDAGGQTAYGEFNVTVTR